MNREMSACTPAIMADLTTSDIFFGWLNGLHATADPLMLSSYTLTPADTITLSTVQTSLQAHSDCLTQLTGSANSVNSANSGKRTQITQLANTLKERQLDVQISQDRALLVRHPEMSRSYYEGILPIGRPLGHYSVPILVGIATFLLSISLFMLLNLFKIDSRLVVPMPSMNSRVQLYNNRPFWMMSGVAIVLLGITIYAFNK